MLAIEASSRGVGSVASRARPRWNVSTQVASGCSTSTWRRFHAMPQSSTRKIRQLRTGLYKKEARRLGESSAPTIATATRKASIRRR